MLAKQQNKRDTLITVRVTRQERELVLAQAAQQGRTVSDLFRERFSLPVTPQGSSEDLAGVYND